MLRRYKLKHSINQGKQKKILAILKESRNASVEISNRQWVDFYKNGKFNRDLKIDTIKSKLSKRYKQTAQYQVVSGLESYLGNRQNEFKDYLKNSNFDSDTKRKLYYINKYKKWFHSSIKMQGEEIDQDIIKLSRRIIKNIFKKNKKPNFKFCNMALDAKVMEITPNGIKKVHKSKKVKDENGGNAVLKLRANNNSRQMNAGQNANWDNTLKIVYDGTDNAGLISGKRYKTITPFVLDARMWHKENKVKDRMYIGVDFVAK